MLSQHKLQKFLEETTVPDSLAAELAAMSDNDFTLLAEDTQSLLNTGDVHESEVITAVAVLKEQYRRSQALQEQVTRLQAELREKQNVEKQLLQEHHQQLRTKEKMERMIAEGETTGKLVPRRNDPCPCGSGKKYKQCCGK